MKVAATPAIRALTEEERDIYAGAVIQASAILPAWRDGIALLRPFYDATAGTAYVDQYSRVGLSPWFFEALGPFQRASVILHETSHVLYNYFVRLAAMGGDPKIGNVASDFEINTGLETVPRVDLSFAIFPQQPPYNFPKFLTQEAYYGLLADSGLEMPSNPDSGAPDPNCPEHGDKSDDSGAPQSSSEDPTGGAEPGEGEGKGEAAEAAPDSGSNPGEADGAGEPGPGGSECTCPSQGQGGGKPGAGKSGDTPHGESKVCDEATEGRVAAADDAGVERASDVEQAIAKSNTAVRVAEEARQQRAAGNGTMADFLEFSMERMAPPKVDWRSIFRRLVSRMDETIVRGRSDYSYRRTSRRLTSSKFIFPGMVEYQPKIMLGIDTSGSMGQEDFLAIASEVEGILKSASRTRDQLRVFSVDTVVSNVKPVASVAKLDLRGGGGTDMSVAWKYVNQLPKRERPDLFVLASDSHTDWVSIQKQLELAKPLKYKSIVLATTSSGHALIPEEVHRLATVVDISEGR